MGTRLYHIPWTGDFSDARNRVLDLATGDWILSVDADERLRFVSRSEIEQSLNDPANIAYHVSLHPKTGWTGMWVLRLFRNDPEIRFRGIFHETPWKGLEKVLSRDAKELGFSCLVLDHLGYDDADNQREKLMRNRFLLLKEIEINPANAYDSLATCHFKIGNYTEAQKYFEQAEKSGPNPMEYKVKRQLCEAMMSP
ncbi:MAG: hypothetical protein U5R49_09875 [Deltaproteobacteria bacterium]|nr:hypothetical protein [Deltaproteobacteria bacterium]